MDITVNGKAEQTASENIAAYIENKRLNPKALVVEYNGEIVPSDRWPRTRLRPGDCLELLSFVGGG